MENNKQYLQFLYNEDLFVIKGDDAIIAESKSYVDTSENKETKVEEPATQNTAPMSGDQEEVRKQPETPQLAISGDAESAVCIINFDSQNEFIAPEQKTFLENILKAVQLDINKVALINKAKTDHGLLEITHKIDAKTFLIFADTDAMNKYVISEEGGKQLLAADSLNSISNDKEKKKALWTNLQQLFLK